MTRLHLRLEGGVRFVEGTPGEAFLATEGDGNPVLVACFSHATWRRDRYTIAHDDRTSEVPDGQHLDRAGHTRD